MIKYSFMCQRVAELTTGLMILKNWDTAEASPGAAATKVE